MKGFILTIVSVSMIALLVVLSTALQDSHLSMERALVEPRSLSYGAFLFDDVAYSINNITGTGLGISQTNVSTLVVIEDTIPKRNYTEDLLDYEVFLETEIANMSHALIDANFSEIHNGTYEVRINGGYVYSNHMLDEEMLFTNPSSTGAKAYEIYITTDGTRANLTAMEMNSSGDLNVTIHYMDKNGSISSDGQVHSHKSNRMEVEYMNGGSLRLGLGSVGGNHGSLWMEAENVSAEFSFSVLLPPADSDTDVGFEYPCPMNYTQGNVMILRDIGS